MKRFIPITFFLSLLVASGLNAQEEEKNYGITWSGFVKTDIYYDSRQVVSAREGHLLLWPAAPSLDVNDEDINARGGTNIQALQTRLTGKITGPDALGAKTSGVIEGAFFGVSNTDVNGFRLRHAFVKLNWTSSELLVGQYWHPMFVTASFPGTVSFNTGLPFQPFSRNPQVRFTYGGGNLKFMVAALAHRDFTTAGGSAELRNSGLPDLQAQLTYQAKNAEAGTDFLLGAGAGYKKVMPRLSTAAGYVTEASVGSLSFQGFAKAALPAVTVKVEAVYGQNMYDMLQLSSYATLDMVNPTTDERSYTPLGNYSLWTDLQTNGNVQVGLFTGYTASTGTSFLGSETELQYTAAGNYVYAGTRANIDHVWRVAPRLVYNVQKIRLAAEVEATGAAFGDVNSLGMVEDATSVTNTRILLAVFYFF
ncbi:MAG: hypothetical protein R2751_10605 [Bacteroidales bacterium]